MVRHRKSLVILFVILCLNKSFQNTTNPDAKHVYKRYGEALEAIFGIGIRLQTLLVDPALPNVNNFIISPLSAAVVVTQMMLGADEEFRNELYNLLSIPNVGDHKHSLIYYVGKPKNTTFVLPYARLHSQMGSLMRALKGNELSRTFTLNCSNGLFANSDLELKDYFVHNLQIYETDIRYLNFSSDPTGSQKIINNWAAFHTNNVIKSILPSPLPKTTSAVLANAIYFAAEWETPFSNDTNIKGVFHSSNDTDVEVEYMRAVFDNVLYAESKKLGCKILALPYKDRELSMYFLLPNENNGEEYNIKNFTESMKINETLELILTAQPHKVSVQIPKMNLSNSISVLEPLQRYQLYIKQYLKQSESDRGKSGLDMLDERIELFNAFNTSERPDILLNEAAENKVLKITDIIQQATLSVNEKGTEAASVTSTIIDYIGGSKLFKLTRPFAFFIRHELTQAVLFWGTIVDPSQTT